MQYSSENSSLQLFEYEGASVRTTVIDGEVWFVAKDVCDILCIQNHRDAISEIDDDEVLRGVGIGDSSKLRNDGSVPTLISEPGLYALVFKSRKPEAKAFARWVRHEVLPQVMRSGCYTNPAYDINAVRKLAVEQSKLQARKNYWMDLAASFEPVSKILLKQTARGFYDVPDYVREEPSDRSDLSFLRSLLLAATEFVSSKIRALENREHILDCAARY